MTNDLGTKLIVVADIRKCRFFKAQGLKIIEEIADLELLTHDQEHVGPEKHDNHFQKRSTPGSAFEPHTQPKDIDHQDSARLLCEQLNKAVTNSDIKEIIIVADAKSLGYIRPLLSKQVANLVTKELVKDLTHHSLDQIEEIVNNN